MSQRIKVAQTDQVRSGQRKLVRAKGHEIVLFNLEGTFYAINSSCPHSTGPLNEGRLFGTTITCPWHGARFDVTNGQCLGGPATTNAIAFPVQVDGSDIIIELP